ncbi:antibiotic biosynthesis monooxygenase family protein [Litchfieldella rifensis]|uniref:Antibiotic biosynthesis monooxygenase family protein n=1 Tax=Litchfieldella rifensis TaxID=762643 RepID=A0ABV7LVF2_9GAMM
MLAIILEFDVIPGKEEAFREAWEETTKYIHTNFGSLGSRLHRAEDGKFIAYAQWPDHETYEKEHDWSEEGIKCRERMRSTLKSEQVIVLHKLDVDTDLLEQESSPH